MTLDSFSPSASSTSSKTARASGKASARSLPMPTDWLPWPGKVNAIDILARLPAMSLVWRRVTPGGRQSQGGRQAKPAQGASTSAVPIGSAERGLPGIRSAAFTHFGTGRIVCNPGLSSGWLRPCSGSTLASFRNMTCAWSCSRPSSARWPPSRRSISSTMSAGRPARCGKSGWAWPQRPAGSASGRPISSPCSPSRREFRAATMSRSPLLSLVAAIVLTGIGLGVALSRTLPGASWLGGAIVGGGIAAMHYTGMAAFEIQGRIIWDPVLVIVSIAAGALIGAAATRVGLIEGEPKWKVLRRAAAHRRHLQPPFHGDGRGLDHARPQDRRVRNRHPDRLARRRGRACQPGDPAARLLRPCARHTRPAPAGAGDRPHARPRQRRRRRAAGLRRRDDRHRKPQLCRPRPASPRNRSRERSCRRSCPTNRADEAAWTFGRSDRNRPAPGRRRHRSRSSSLRAR